MGDPFKQDIQAMYALADASSSLNALIPTLYATLRRNEASLRGVTYAYRLHASDTGYETAFALTDGRFEERAAGDTVDVTVYGTETNLLHVFQRKLNPAAGLLLGKLKFEGSKGALLKLASFL
ncbi:MAG: SCP2 sterol-binding domain-containing protein [Candidatus Limiplasma sp.]|nr:SCP2 sterol-binding domain-containing protein [Candidatus Limiplasma sp.]